ncbi:hypothetical protein [Haloarchaeobius sp. DFWS5]
MVLEGLAGDDCRLPGMARAGECGERGGAAASKRTALARNGVPREEP